MTDIVVETWGNDETGDGSSSNPYATLMKAVEVASAAKEESYISLGAGSFIWDRNENVNNTNMICIMGKFYKTVIKLRQRIEFANLMIGWLVVDSSYSNLNITGLDLMQSFSAYNCVFRNCLTGPICNQAETECVIKNCTFSDISGKYCIDYQFNHGVVPVIEGCCVDKSSKSGITLTDTAVASVEESTAFNVEVDPITYFLQNADNKLYGVYSGNETSWKCGYLLFMDGKYYSILPDHYVDGAYQEIDLDTAKVDENAMFNYLFFPHNLFDDVIIGEGESAVTFKPIEKFDNFQLVDFNSFALPDPLTAKVIKEYSEMMVMTIPASMISYITIHSIHAICEGTVQLAFSFDEGTTWKTNDTGSWEDLPVTIPLKEYTSFSEDDMTNWNSAKEQILENGIDAYDLDSDWVDFNIGIKTILVAVVMKKTEYDTPTSFSGLRIVRDSMTTYERVDSSECKIIVAGDSIEAIPSFDNNELIINLSTTV